MEFSKSWHPFCLTYLFSLGAQGHPSYFSEGEKRNPKTILSTFFCSHIFCLPFSQSRESSCAPFRMSTSSHFHFMPPLPSKNIDPAILPFSLVSSAFSSKCIISACIQILVLSLILTKFSLDPLLVNSTFVLLYSKNSSNQLSMLWFPLVLSSNHSSQALPFNTSSKLLSCLGHQRTLMLWNPAIQYVFITTWVDLFLLWKTLSSPGLKENSKLLAFLPLHWLLLMSLFCLLLLILLILESCRVQSFQLFSIYT